MMDQVALPSSIPHDFPQLLQCPVRVWVRRHIDMRQATGPVFDNNEHVQHPKRRSDSHEEVACKDRRGVVTQKGRPALIAARITGGPYRHVLPDCPWRNAQAELHQQFIGDAFLAPQWVLPRHPSNELSQLQRNRWPSWP